MKSRYNSTGCRRCGLHFSLGADASRTTLKYSSISNFIVCNKHICFSYTEVYCDLPIPADVNLGKGFNEHFARCGADSPTIVEPSYAKYFVFNNQGSAINHRFSGEPILYIQLTFYHSYLGFYDFETFVKPLPTLCLDCEIIISASSSKTMKERITRDCVENHQFRQTEHRCCACRADIRTSLSNTTCTHNSADKYLDNCFNCFREIETAAPPCNHSKSQHESELVPSAYSLVIVDNYSGEIIHENNYVQTHSSKPDVIPEFLYRLRNDVLPRLAPLMDPKVPMQLNAREETIFQNATKCYLCNCRIWGAFKHADHDHITGEMQAENIFCAFNVYIN